MTNRHLFVSLPRKGLALVFLLALAGAGEASADSETFGQCLSRSGATFYGASWCPVCKRQRGILGRTMSQVRYIECSVDGKRGGQSPECRAANVDGYPTWVFANGSRASGSLSLARLASKTGCRLDSSATSEEEGDSDAIPVHRSRTGGGGGLTIEIP